ncbi:hypothetical protein F4678DRAFT_450899 [Xylaria arbuscula]|nr:hypothetical protein F4678DRAFT_450899 [Xylaria arbuscula]
MQPRLDGAGLACAVLYAACTAVQYATCPRAVGRWRSNLCYTTTYLHVIITDLKYIDRRIGVRSLDVLRIWFAVDRY